MVDGGVMTDCCAYLCRWEEVCAVCHWEEVCAVGLLCCTVSKRAFGMVIVDWV